MREEKERTKSPARAIADVEWQHDMKPGTLASRKVSKFISKARREAILRLRELGLSFPEIGAHLKRDHSSVMKLVSPVEKPVENRVEKQGISSGKTGDKKSKKRK